MKVRCNWCEWVGNENELIVIDEIEYCPHCGTKGALMDLDDDDDEEGDEEEWNK